MWLFLFCGSTINVPADIRSTNFSQPYCGAYILSAFMYQLYNKNNSRWYHCFISISYKLYGFFSIYISTFLDLLPVIQTFREWDRCWMCFLYLGSISCRKLYSILFLSQIHFIEDRDDLGINLHCEVTIVMISATLFGSKVERIKCSNVWFSDSLYWPRDVTTNRVGNVFCRVCPRGGAVSIPWWTGKGRKDPPPRSYQ